MSNLISEVIKANNDFNTSKSVESIEEFIARGGFAYYPNNIKKAIKSGLFNFRNRKWLKKYN